MSLRPFSKYHRAYEELGSFAEVARKFNVDESTVRRSVQRFKAYMEDIADADDGLRIGMRELNIDTTLPSVGWIKSQKPDENGRTYSFMINTRKERDEEAAEERAAAIEDRFRSIRAVKLEQPNARKRSTPRVAFIPLNDLHAGAYAWAQETGYADWDIDKATARLQSWVGKLLRRIEDVDQIILYYNGDTLHTNGEVPMTPASGHILDKDSRHFKVVDMTTEAIIATADMAAQAAPSVRLVIKRGNHDEDSYLALLMGCKYRYREMSNVIVEEDPSPYWAHTFGSVFLFGHHGDRVKPEQLVMKMAADHAEIWGQTKHRVVWTAHKHQREMKSFYGATWEQASCLTDPDSYGSYWGNHAQAQAVIYDGVLGEVERYTVKP